MEPPTSPQGGGVAANASDGGQDRPGPSGPPLPPRPPLRRPREGRIVAGVAAGLADHLDLDVAIVRILLVVLTIVTSGVALLGYLAAILLVPAAEPGAPRPDPRRQGTSGTPRDPLFWVGVGLLVVGALWVIGGPLNGIGPRATGLVGELAVPLVLIAFGLALWRAGERRAGPPTPAAPDPDPYATRPSVAPSRASTTEHPVTTPTSTLGPDRPALDAGTGHRPSEAGATGATDTMPMAWPGSGDRPPPPPVGFGPAEEPAWTPPPAPERPRSLVTRVTLGLAFVTAGVLWSLQAADVVSIGWGRIAAAFLLVIGIGLLVGSVAGRARWLILVGALVAPFVLVWQVASPWSSEDLGTTISGWVGIVDGRASGEIRETPLTADQVAPSYELGAGSIVLDLTELDLDGQTVTTSVDVAAGEIEVEVPDDVEVDVTARSGIGEVDLFGRDRASGINAGERRVVHGPVDPEGRIELDVSAGLGEVTVELVPAAPAGRAEPGDPGDPLTR